MKGVGGGRFEPEPIVKVAGMLIRVGHDGSDANGLSDCTAAQQRILEERGADAPPLKLDIDCESGNEKDRDRAFSRLPL